MPTLAIMIGYALWFMFVISWNVTARPARTIATAGAPRERLYGLVIALGLAMLVVAPFLLARGGFQLWINPPLLAWAMLLIVAAGVALCWWARLHLGRLWSANVTHKEGHRVVDTGPYRLVRHPIYTGFIVMDVGLALLCGSALAFAGAAVITVGLWIKARLEEQFLIEELGAAAYRTYQSRTPMLLPRMPLPRMPLLLIFCLLYCGFLGAAGTTIDIATPMPAPEWARLERRILADSVPAVKAFFAKYYDERGYFRHVVRWGANDGPDDAFENTTGWPELHALGASDEILQLHLKAWEGMLRQFTEARTTDVPIGRQGMYYKDFSVQSDWMHHGEALRTFNVLALSVPALPAYQKRARTYAALYMGEDPDAPNYDPQHTIIKSMINGSRGPMLRKATALDWVGDPFDVSKFVALHGEDSYEQFLAHYQEYTDVVGDHFLNLVATTLPLNAYLLDNEPKYKRWLVEYMDAWLARMKRNGGVIPSYVALDGTIGGPEGKWWNNAYGWGFSPVNPVTKQREDRNRIPRATVGFANAMLVTGDQKYAEAWRAMIDAVNSHARTVDGRTEYPTMYGDRGWYGWRAAPWNVGALDLWYWSMKSEDRPRIGRNAWVEYLEGKSPDFPATALKRDLDSIPRRMAEMQKDPTTPETRLADNAMEFNPAAVSGLVQLMWGAMVPGREGSLLSARLRYFDPVRRRAGVPEDVAALVSELRDDRTVVTLVNVSQTTARDVVVQGGGYGEHQILSAGVSGRTTSINARDFTVRLAPGAGATLTLAMKRYANPPSAKFPWDR